MTQLPQSLWLCLAAVAWLVVSSALHLHEPSLQEKLAFFERMDALQAESAPTYNPKECMCTTQDLPICSLVQPGRGASYCRSDYFYMHNGTVEMSSDPKRVQMCQCRGYNDCPRRDEIVPENTITKQYRDIIDGHGYDVQRRMKFCEPISRDFASLPVCEEDQVSVTLDGFFPVPEHIKEVLCRCPDDGPVFVSKQLYFPKLRMEEHFVCHMSDCDPEETCMSFDRPSNTSTLFCQCPLETRCFKADGLCRAEDEV